MFANWDTHRELLVINIGRVTAKTCMASIAILMYIFLHNCKVISEVNYKLSRKQSHVI